MDKDNLDLFLRESNAIEDVWDERSLLDAKRAWDYLISFDTLTKENILKAHDILMTNHLPPLERGYFRLVRVWIGGGEAITAKMIPGLFDDWLEGANAGSKWCDEKESHIKFEKIHPFIDGNGRMGRIIMNWQRVKHGKPILVIYEKEKQKYYEWFR